MEYIFIAVAMKGEAKLLLEKLENKKEKNINGINHYIGTIKNKNVIIGISGIGTINMSFMLMLICNKYKISKIINYGLSGGYEEDIKTGDIIVGSECMNINSYATKKSKNVDISNLEIKTFDEDNDELVIYNADKTLLDEIVKSNNNIKIGRLGSGDVWNKEHDKINLLNKKYNILCEDMESIAVYQISNKLNIPCISIRGISNNEILNQEYDKNVINKLVEFVYNYINLI